MDIRSILQSTAETIQVNPQADHLRTASLLFMSMHHVPLTAEESNTLTIGINGLRSWLAELPPESNFVISYFMSDPNSGKRIERFRQPMLNERSLRLEFRIPFNRSNSPDEDPLAIREPFEKKQRETEKVEQETEKFRLSCRTLCGLVFSEKLNVQNLKNLLNVDAKGLAEIILTVLEQKEYQDLIFKIVLRKLGPFSPRKEIDAELNGIKNKLITMCWVLHRENGLNIGERINKASKEVKQNKADEIEVSTQYEVELLKERGFNAVLHVENKTDFSIETVEA